MQKTFEFFIILIIFYGVYSAFNNIAPMFWENPSSFWVVVISLIVAALILTLYSFIVSKGTSEKYKKDIEDLQQNIKEKDKELDNAFKIKHDVQEAAEKTIDTD